ncbi:MAG: hypothetical protein NWF06_08245 [Candidatus Bathyarchaeota archaeon]|nr:hypothetical protein [Candidatus Bathyarchaeum sp.]
MRTVEVLFVIVILLGAFTITTQFAVLPSSSQAFGTDLGELAQSTLETLDAQGVLSETVFSDDADAWGDLQKALSASLPVNVVYNLSVYNLSTTSGVVSYQLSKSIADASFGVDSDSASLLVASPDVTFTQDPEKVGGESTDITLYILNCNDANGWWITGYTGQSLATEFYNILSPYFTTTVLLNSTAELQLLLDNSPSLPGDVENAVVINTFGEAVPIPSYYANLYDTSYSDDYARYCYVLGQKTNTYNWTWVSIVGYPFYYVTNTNYFDDDNNGWGIYGMEDSNVQQAGLQAFLQGLTDRDYAHVSTDIKQDVNVVYLTSESIELCNEYGIYPRPYQTSARALDEYYMLDTYQLSALELFNRPEDDSGTTSVDESDYIPAATYTNIEGSDKKGAFTAIGLSRTPDVRITALGLLMYYHPNIYRSEFGASGKSMLVTLQLGQQGGT